MAAIPRRVFCDTSFFFAVLDTQDESHYQAVAIAEWMKEHRIAGITTWEVIVETVTLLRYRLSFHSASVFVRTLLPQLNVVYIGRQQKRKALAHFLKLSSDKKISLCDVVSYIVVKDLLRNIPCAAFDSDFNRLGLNVVTVVE